MAAVLKIHHLCIIRCESLNIQAEGLTRSWGCPSSVSLLILFHQFPLFFVITAEPIVFNTVLAHCNLLNITTEETLSSFRK